MTKLMDLVLKELNKGLSKKENAEADLKCFITYIKDLPNGKGATSTSTNQYVTEIH